MQRLFNATAEGLRMLSFLTAVGLATLVVAPLTGCDQKPVTPGPDAPADDAPADRDIKINAPGVDVEIDRTPDGDGKPDVDVDVLPGTGRGVDVDVDRDPATGPKVDVDVNR